MLLARVHSGADRPEAVEHRNPPRLGEEIGKRDASAIVLAHQLPSGGGGELDGEIGVIARQVRRVDRRDRGIAREVHADCESFTDHRRHGCHLFTQADGLSGAQETRLTLDEGAIGYDIQLVGRAESGTDSRARRSRGGEKSRRRRLDEPLLAGDHAGDVDGGPALRAGECCRLSDPLGGGEERGAALPESQAGM